MDNKENVTRILLICSTCQGKLVIFFIYTTKENLSRKTCQGKLASVNSRQVFLDKWTCQGKIARVNGALDFRKVLRLDTRGTKDFSCLIGANFSDPKTGR